MPGHRHRSSPDVVTEGHHDEHKEGQYEFMDLLIHSGVDGGLAIALGECSVDYMHHPLLTNTIIIAKPPSKNTLIDKLHARRVGGNEMNRYPDYTEIRNV